MTEKIWHLIIPPLLALIDDESTTNKVKGCETLMVLLKVTPSQFLQRTGLGDVFQDALTPCLSYLPSITPEEESIRLLNAVYPSLLSLTSTRYPMPQNGAQRITVLDKILRVGILTGYSHAGELVRIADMLVQRLSDIIELMGSMFVKHLQVIRSNRTFQFKTLTAEGHHTSTFQHTLSSLCHILPTATTFLSACITSDYIEWLAATYKLPGRHPERFNDMWKEDQ